MVGETRGSADIPIRARVSGVLESRSFVEGRRVEKGALLYTIDPVPFQSKVVEAQGGLASALTRLAKAKADLDRIRPLAEMHAVSQQDLDGAVAQYEAALGSRQTAEARVEQAEIELGYTRLHAPISGRIGISQAEVGEFVGAPPNPVVLNFVSKTDPIRVRFSIDERRYLQLARRLRQMERVIGPEAGESPGVPEPAEGQGLELILADGTIHEYRGRTSATDAAVDPATGTFTIEADFPNPEELVLAGQFARIRGVVEVRRNAVLAPQRSVSELQGSFRVFVIGEDGTVELRPVVPGPKVGSLQIVDSGLKEGEWVAYEGIQRLRPGLTVLPTPVELDENGMPVEAQAEPGD
jgi:membrane fusion protein (multidrug efflux system)